MRVTVEPTLSLKEKENDRIESMSISLNVVFILNIKEDIKF